MILHSQGMQASSALGPGDHGGSVLGGQSITHAKILHYTGGLMMPGLGMLVGLLGGLGAVAFRYLIGLFQTLVYGSGADLTTLVQALPWWKVVLGPAIGGAFVGPLVLLSRQGSQGTRRTGGNECYCERGRGNKKARGHCENLGLRDVHRLRRVCGTRGPR